MKFASVTFSAWLDAMKRRLFGGERQGAGNACEEPGASIFHTPFVTHARCPRKLKHQLLNLDTCVFIFNAGTPEVCRRSGDMDLMYCSKCTYYKQYDRGTLNSIHVRRIYERLSSASKAHS